jgi:hypothetical protein
MSEPLFTCIATCQVCNRELNRAEHVPESKKGHVIMTAPMACVCPEKHHNTLSDCNIGVKLEWIEEKAVPSGE